MYLLITHPSYPSDDCFPSSLLRRGYGEAEGRCVYRFIDMPATPKAPPLPAFGRVSPPQNRGGEPFGIFPCTYFRISSSTSSVCFKTASLLNLRILTLSTSISLERMASYSCCVAPSCEDPSSSITNLHDGQ